MLTTAGSKWQRHQPVALQPGAVSGTARMSRREVEVLRFMAEGLDTAEIAERLSCSQRTVQNVVHGVTMRLKLRNRSHAVAYAVRCGLI
jgi:DNA-binding CsgD family transcriptional regulator